ncbi:hypothetical protein [Sphingobacterium sp. LRF_L2]|uniref:hypothetical protein n=1 Tax=Sphingobacterium sp. LRF_L2 TaxID=3369421 RepID=UPI003F5E88E4
MNKKTNIWKKTLLTGSAIAICFLLTFSSCASAQSTDSVDFQQRERLLTAYLQTKDAFAKNDIKSFKTSLGQFQAEIKTLRLKGLVFEDMARLKKVRDSLRISAEQLQQVKKVADAKASISEMGTQMWSLIEKMKFAEDPIYLQYCPMEEAYWVSEEKAIFNPFSPKIMPKCGTVVKGLTEEDYKVEACCH